MEFGVGARVALHGLRAVQYNGLCGSVVVVREDGRRGVRLDGKKKDELMAKIKAKQDQEEKTRKRKQEMIDKLKEKENKIMMGQKQKAEASRL